MTPVTTSPMGDAVILEGFRSVVAGVVRRPQAAQLPPHLAFVCVPHQALFSRRHPLDMDMNNELLPVLYDLQEKVANLCAADARQQTKIESLQTEIESLRAGFGALRIKAPAPVRARCTAGLQDAAPAIQPEIGLP